jgi:hypothetical protein
MIEEDNVYIHGERNRNEKLKAIEDSQKSTIQSNIEQAKRRFILFVCSQCGLQIFYESKDENHAYMSYKYNNFQLFFENEPGFIPFENNYKNTDQDWSSWCKRICLGCGLYIENEEKICEQCGSEHIVNGNELAGEPCPVCGTAFSEGLVLQGWDAYFAKTIEISNDWYDKYRIRYNVKEPAPAIYSKEELLEQGRRENLLKLYEEDEKYILDNPHNALRFVFDNESLLGTFYSIVEWENGGEGKLTFFQRFGSSWIEKTIKWNEIEQIIKIINKYDFFNKSLYLDMEGLDGWTIGLEVKIGDNYKELGIWGITNGVLYDIGMLLIQLAGKTFKELYEYAW